MAYNQRDSATLLVVLNSFAIIIFLVAGAFDSRNINNNLQTIYTSNIENAQDIENIRVSLERTEQYSFMKNQSTLRGQYNPKARAIFVDINQSSERVIQAMMHEYGHFVYYQVLSRDEVAMWTNISNQSNNYVTNYARTSPSEDFAETFAEGISCTYLLEGKDLEMDYNKSRFIQEKAVTKLIRQEALQ